MVRLPDKPSDDSQGKQSEKQAQGSNDASPGLTALSHEVKELVRLISTTDVTELHIESGEMRIIIKRGSTAPPQEGHSRPTSAYIPPATLPEPAATNPITLIGQNPVHGEELTLSK